MALNGLVFYFQGLPVPTKNSLTKIITDNEGTVSFIFGKNITHLVSTQSEIQANGYKIQQCVTLNIKPITEKWIKDRIAAYKPVVKKVEPKDTKSNNKTADKPDTSKGLAFAAPKVEKADPTVTLVLPNSAPNNGDFKLALFGLDFEPSARFKVSLISKNQQQSVTASNVEFHATTAILATFDKFLVPHGEYEVKASNDGLKYGIGSPVQLFDPYSPAGLHGSVIENKAERELLIMKSQLENVKRAVYSVQRLENDLSQKLQIIASGGSLTYYDPLYVQQQEQLTITDGQNQLELIPDQPQVTSIVQTQQLFEREIRLFISSPFKDMQKERDYIVKLVVPQIRRMCMDRDIIFNYVDLRWGVTEAQSAQSTMLLMCLRELSRSNMFVGCLGERYGYSVEPTENTGLRSPAEVEQQEQFKRAFQLATKEYPWIKDYTNRSLTEVEMRYVLRKVEEQAEKNNLSAWFFLRDHYYIEEVPEAEKAIYQAENPASQQKIEQLKEDIKEASYPHFTYKRPSDLPETLIEKLKDHIDRNFPEDHVMSEFERESLRHQVYSRSLTTVYLPNEELFIAIDKYIVSQADVPLVVTGPIGIGKSSLLANWAKRHYSHHPEDTLIEHWVSCSPSASDHIALMHRILSEIAFKLQLDAGHPLSEIANLSQEKDFQRILEEFPVWMEKLGSQFANRRFIIIIDGLDNIINKNNAAELTWFPRTFPANVRVITSTSEKGAQICLKILQKRKAQILELEPLHQGQRKSFIVQYLQEARGKKLNEKQELAIAESHQTGNPRFLQTFLDEICISATFDDLDQKITTCLRANNSAELYEIVIKRLDKDYDPQGKGFIKAMLCLIWASHNGLHSSNELAFVLTRPGKNGVILATEAEFSTLYLLIGDLLTNSGGLLMFSNEEIALAVEKTYLKDKNSRIQYHKMLADLFNEIKEDNISSKRVLEELPWHLEKSGQMEELCACLCDIRIADQMCSPQFQYELVNYWRTLEISGKKIEQEYAKMISHAQYPPGMVRADLMFKVAKFLEEMSKFDAAEQTFLLARTHYENSSSTLKLAQVDFELGDMFSTRNYDQALKYLKRSLACYLQEGAESIELVMTMERLGSLHMNMGNIPEAKSVLEKALNICERRFGHNNNVTADVIYALGCITLIEAKSGCGGVDQEKAEQWLRKALDIKASILGDWHPEVARVLNRLASIYVEQNQFNDAEACYEQALFIREEKLGKNHARTLQTVKHMISCYEMQEKVEQAISYSIRAHSIADAIYGELSGESSAIVLRLGILYWVNGRNGDAIKCFDKAKHINTMKYGANSKQVKDIEKTVSDLRAADAPPPPPPPPPFAFAPPPPASKPVMAVPVQQFSGIPPPPPPPPPVAIAPPPPKVSYQQHVDLLQDIKKVGLKHADVQYHDRSDAKSQAQRMMGCNKRKIALKKLK